MVKLNCCFKRIQHVQSLICTNRGQQSDHLADFLQQLLTQDGTDVGKVCRHCIDLTYSVRNHCGMWFLWVGRLTTQVLPSAHAVKIGCFSRIMFLLNTGGSCISHLGHQWRHIQSTLNEYTSCYPQYHHSVRIHGGSRWAFKSSFGLSIKGLMLSGLTKKGWF